MKQKIIKLLEKERDKKSNSCMSWSKSDDRGACFDNEVKPIDEMIKYMEKVEDE